jgi:hypothetical protein
MSIIKNKLKTKLKKKSFVSFESFESFESLENFASFASFESFKNMVSEKNILLSLAWEKADQK